MEKPGLLLPWLVGVTVALFTAIMYIPQSFYSVFSFDSYPHRNFSMPICLGMYLVFLKFNSNPD